MAWIKEIKRDDNGAVARYWEVMSVYYSKKEQKSHLMAGGWVDQQAYEDGLQPLMLREWDIPSGLAPRLATDAVSFVSEYAKSQPEFEGWENA